LKGFCKAVADAFKDRSEGSVAAQRS